MDEASWSFLLDTFWSEWVNDDLYGDGTASQGPIQGDDARLNTQSDTEQYLMSFPREPLTDLNQYPRAQAADFMTHASKWIAASVACIVEFRN
jgi:hypothetical protein